MSLMYPAIGDAARTIGASTYLRTPDAVAYVLLPSDVDRLKVRSGDIPECHRFEPLAYLHRLEAIRTLRHPVSLSMSKLLSSSQHHRWPDTSKTLQGPINWLSWFLRGLCSWHV